MKKPLGFLVLGVFVLCLILLTIGLWQAYHANGEDSLGLLAYILGLFVIPTVIIGLFAVYASSLRTKKAPRTSPTPHISPKVLAALKLALTDKDPDVRSKAVVGLTDLDLEESSHHYDHDDLDDALISALKDPHPIVRSKVVEGLSEVELELFTHHKHDQMEHARLEDMARAFMQ